MVEGDCTHQGEVCTFETLIKSFGLEGDFAFSKIAEIVHDIDLKDNKYNRLEAVGFNAVIRGISAVLPMTINGSKSLLLCSTVYINYSVSKIQSNGRRK